MAQPARANAASASGATRSAARAAARVVVRNTIVIIGANGYYRGSDVHAGPSQARISPEAQLADGSPVTQPHDLKSAGLKATVSRLRIIHLFETSKVRHLTAEVVYKLLLADGLDIGLATVYR